MAKKKTAEPVAETPKADLLKGTAAIMARRTRRGAHKGEHSSGFLVRLPEVYRDALDEARKTTRRPYTEEIKVALEAHLGGMGLWPPKEHP